MYWLTDFELINSRARLERIIIFVLKRYALAINKVNKGKLVIFTVDRDHSYKK